MMRYIPILRTALAELWALQSISLDAKKKITPYLFYRDTKQRTSLDKFCEVLTEYEKFFLEFPDHPNNNHYRTIDEQLSKFQKLIQNGYPVIPVVNNSQKVKRRQLVQHGLRLLNLAGNLGIRVRIDNQQDIYIAAAIYDASPNPDKLIIFVDFSRLRSKDVVLEKFPRYLKVFEEATVVFTGTVWGKDQREFEKGEISSIDNYLYLAWTELEENIPYSDTLTDNLESVIPTDETFPGKIIPYFKWISLDGADFLVVRATENVPALAKEIARELKELYPHYFHPKGKCIGCDEISEVADPESNSKSNATTRKKMSFVHHMEVIASLLP